MTAYRRYAIYYAPPSRSPLALFGAGWLGWDLERAAPVAHPEVANLPLDAAAITATPRRYGFHGTLKPPFRLAPGAAPGDFAAAAEALAARIAPFDAPPLALSRLGGFLALTPSAPSPRLADLAFRCVSELDAFRAPPTEAELARRRANELSAGQEAMLARWGYPYVGDEFRFHLTLTGWFEARVADAIRAALAPAAAPFLEAPMPVREIALCGEIDGGAGGSGDHDGRFHLIRRFPLTG